MARIDIGVETYDSFADIDFADLFLLGDVLRAAGWALRNEDAKGRGLVSATRMIMGLPWCVDPVPQPTDADADIPAAVKEVTAQLAADLLAKPRLFSDASGNSNVKSARAGSAAVEFFRPVEGGPPIPVELWNRLVREGLVGCVTADGFEAPFVSGAWAGRRPLGGRCADDWPVAEQDHD